MGVVELRAVQIELDGAPGVAAEQVGEVVGQLLLGQVIDLTIEIGTDTARGCRVHRHRWSSVGGH